MAVQVFSCLREARSVLVDVEIFRSPRQVRVKNGFADKNKRLRFVQVGRGVLPTTPPHQVAIVGTGGRQVLILPSVEVIPLGF